MSSPSPQIVTGARKEMPYLLTIVVHSGHGLPVADMTSSDPYVSICVQGKEVSRTKVVVKNLNPVWEHFYELPCLHPHVDIKFLVYDCDFRSMDDLMGVVNINIDDYSSAGEVEDVIMNRKRFMLQQGQDSIKPCGHLEMSILLIRNKEIIALSRNTPEHFPPNSAGVHTESLLQSCGMTGPCSHADHRPMFNTLSPLRRALHAFTLPPPTFSFPTPQQYEVTRDILMDIHNCMHQIARDLQESEQFSLLRRNRFGKLAQSVISSSSHRTSSSSSIKLKALKKGGAGAVEASYDTGRRPTHEICLTFRILTGSSSGSKKELKLHLPNKYALWIWLRWIALAIEVWEGTRESPLPLWAQSDQLVTTGAVLEIVEAYKAEGLTAALAMEYLAPLSTSTFHHGTASLSLKAPYTIRIADAATNKVLDEFSFESVGELFFSIDAPAPKTHSLQLEINSASTALNSTVANSTLNLSGAESFFVVVRSTDGHYHKTASVKGPCPHWDESVYLDCNKDHATGAVDLFMFKDNGPYPATMLSHANVKYRDMFSDMCVVFNDKNSGLGPGPGSQGSPLPPDDTIASLLVPMAGPCEYRVTALLGDDFHMPAQQEGAPLSMPGLVLKCAPVDWNGKKTSSGGSLPTTLSADLKSPVAAWKGKNADWGGYSFKVLPSYGIEWCRYIRVRVLATVGLVGEELVGTVYIPVSDFAEKGVEKKYPVQLTPSKSATAVELVRLGRCPHLHLNCCRVSGIDVLAAPSTGGAGEPMRSSNTDPVPNSRPNPNPNPRPNTDPVHISNPGPSGTPFIPVASLTTHMRLRRSNEYTAYWTAEAVSPASLASAQVAASTGQREKGIEYFSCAPGYEGIVLENIAQAVLAKDRGVRRGIKPDTGTIGTGSLIALEIDGVDPPSPYPYYDDSSLGVNPGPQSHPNLDPSPTFLSSSLDASITVTLYQHQRRRVFPPFPWTHHLICGDPPAYMDEACNRCNFATPPPPGTPTQCLAPVDMEWVGDWKAEEWEYGSSFQMFSKGKAGPGRGLGCGLACVRRRRWVRMAAPMGNKIGYSVEKSSLRDDAKLKASRARNQHKDVVFNSLESCGSNGAAVVIPWSQVHSVDIISPSILCLNATINQYFCDAKGKEKYHPVNIDIFLTSCPAVNLHSLMLERLEFARPVELADGSEAPDQRRQLVEAIVQLKCCIEADKPYDFSVPLVDDGWGNCYPQAIEMPPGVLLCMMLDHDAAFQEHRLQSLLALTSAKAVKDTDTVTLGRTLCTFQRGALRRRVYIAALHAAASYYRQDATLDASPTFAPCTPEIGDGRDNKMEDGKRAGKGASKQPEPTRAPAVSFCGADHVGFDMLFDTDELEEGIRRDFEAGEAIKLESSVATTKNRTNFLLDMFECRMRFLCLCGWNLQGGTFEEAAETLINGYFIVIVSKYARFFDSKVFEQFQGLNSKITLIATLMDHDNKLASIVEEALQMYDLKAEPTPSLSHFLSVDKIISWYSRVLQEEMSHLVDRVARQCQHDSKSDSAAEYTVSLPWYPTRMGGDAPLCSTMPEDIEKFLREYLQVARLNEAIVTEKFKASVDVLDAKVYLSYAQSFLRLSKVYWLALNRTSDWADFTDELYTDTVHNLTPNPAPDDSSSSSTQAKKRDPDMLPSLLSLPSASPNQLAAIKRRAQELLDQRAEFLCSLANDALRINASRLHTSAGGMSAACSKAALAEDATSAASHRASVKSQLVLKKAELALRSVVQKVCFIEFAMSHVYPSTAYFKFLSIFF